MDLYDKYLASALHFLGYRPRSEKEVRDNLWKKFNRARLPESYMQDAEKVIERVVEFLKEQKFLNDEEFVRWWVESRTRFKQRSKWVILKELQEKGIRKEFAQRFLEKDDSPQIDDFAQAKALVEKRISKYASLSKPELYQKLGAFLGRKGFSWEVIKRSIDDVWQNKYNTD